MTSENIVRPFKVGDVVRASLPESLFMIGIITEVNEERIYSIIVFTLTYSSYYPSGVHTMWKVSALSHNLTKHLARSDL